MAYFVTYLRQYMKENRIKRLIGKGHYKETVSSIRATTKTKTVDDSKLIAELTAQVTKEESEKMSLLQTLSKLNSSRKELIALVGYDGALLVPSFGFLILGALMTSVIPHYYGACVHCLATATTTTRPEVVTALLGLGISTFLGALFTGARGSLFWLAGRFRCQYEYKSVQY